MLVWLPIYGITSFHTLTTQLIDSVRPIVYILTHQGTMSTTTTTTTTAAQPTLQLTAALKDGVAPNYGDWRDDLIRDGYAIVKGAIPRERADGYANAMYDWLEGL